MAVLLLSSVLGVWWFGASSVSLSVPTHPLLCPHFLRASLSQCAQTAPQRSTLKHLVLGAPPYSHNVPKHLPRRLPFPPPPPSNGPPLQDFPVEAFFLRSTFSSLQMWVHTLRNFPGEICNHPPHAECRGSWKTETGLPRWVSGRYNKQGFFK